MNSATRRLRLGPLRRSENVKITIVLTADLKEALDRYAVVHSQVHGEHVDTAALIPHMLEAFIARDRGFKAMLSSGDSPSVALRADPASEA
ncbi:MAG: DUF2274 domain-containing protein [Betaproteobacteria bacterium HGW-Betaproteobacteria-3]|jgi:hypothetical protein|nr:MAG: DUF2274 domain-containing protein [Betaproteobacteria bacterium HGW-Betaproteobacteria-3]